MLHFLPAFLRGSIASLLLVINTGVCGSVLLVFALVKLLVPIDAVRKRVDPILNWIAQQWIANNHVWEALTQRVSWKISGVQDLRRRGWYLIEANHQSWADIFVLQRALNRRVPLLKFFLKRELIYVPIIGVAWWALDFPFMRRYSEEYLEKHPEKRGKDLETIRASCAKFTLIPTSVMNFLEGTRFTPEKHAAQQSPYRHLLRPKAGGIALALNAMGEAFHSLLDVTIYYPGGIPTFWDYLCGRLGEVVVNVRELPIPRDLFHGDYTNDPTFRRRVQEWVTALWEEKDRMIDAMSG